MFNENNPQYLRFTNIKWEDPPPHAGSTEGRTELRINEHLTFTDIPPEAHNYTLNGLSPLDWIVKQYVVRQDYVDPDTNKIKTNRTGKPLENIDGIINDPNNLFTENYTIINLIEQVVQLSITTAELTDKLDEIEYWDGKPQTQDVL